MDRIATNHSRQPAPAQPGPAGQRFGVDRSVAHSPADAALTAAGVTFACRYPSHPPAKNLGLLTPTKSHHRARDEIPDSR